MRRVIVTHRNPVELSGEMSKTKSGIVTTSQWLGCWAVRLEALPVGRVIVIHRNPVELSGDMSKTKSGIVTSSQWLGCWAVRLEALLLKRVIIIHRNRWSCLVITSIRVIVTHRNLWSCLMITSMTKSDIVTAGRSLDGWSVVGLLGPLRSTAGEKGYRYPSKPVELSGDKVGYHYDQPTVGLLGRPAKDSSPSQRSATPANSFPHFLPSLLGWLRYSGADSSQLARVLIPSIFHSFLG